MSVLLTCPGKIGDAFHQWPLAWWWAKENNQKIRVGLDVHSLSGLKDLFESQDCVEKVELLEGIKSYHCGGQPWNFGWTHKTQPEGPIVHLGYHIPPNEQLTYFVRRKYPFIGVSDEDLEETQTLFVGKRLTQSRVLIHVQAICPHTRKPPTLLRLLPSIAPLLERFDQKVFIGLPHDIPDTMPEGWTTFADGGNWKLLAQYMNNSALVVGVGSSPVALAGILKVPCVRFHDPISGIPDHRVFNNLGKNQLNLAPGSDYEAEVRKFVEEWCPKPSEVS